MDIEKLIKLQNKVKTIIIKSKHTPEEVIELNHIFEIHGRYIDLLIRKTEKEEQYRTERTLIIDDYYTATEALAVMKSTRKKQIRKAANVEIDAQLEKEIRAHIKKEKSTLTQFFNDALQSYQKGMKLTCKMNSKERKRVTVRISPENLVGYQNLTMKRTLIEQILGTYLDTRKETGKSLIAKVIKSN